MVRVNGALVAGNAAACSPPSTVIEKAFRSGQLKQLKLEELSKDKYLVRRRSLVVYVVINIKKKQKKLNVGLPVTDTVNGFIGTVLA